MKQLRYIPFYIALLSINGMHAIPAAQYWNNLLRYVREHKEKVSDNKPVLIGAAGLIGLYGLWRITKHNRAETLYTSAKIIHAKLSDHYIQECALINETNSLDAIITSAANERMQPLHAYLDEITQAVNTTHALHEKLHCMKTYVTRYHPDTQKVLNNLAQLHNNLYLIKKQVFGIIGLQLCAAFSDEYIDEIMLLGQTFPQLSQLKTLRLIDFSNETMRDGLHTIIMQKYNTPTMQYPYLAYFTQLQTNMNQLTEGLHDIAQTHPAYRKISRLLAQLRIIGKFVVTDKNYIKEKQNTQEQLCLQKVETEMQNLQNSFDGIQADFEQLKEGHDNLESRIGALEENRAGEQENEETENE